MIEVIGWIITVIAVGGVLLNNRRHRACFALWLGSNALSAGVHLSASMYALATRDGIFLLLAVQGWILWGREAGIAAVKKAKSE